MKQEQLSFPLRQAILTLARQKDIHSIYCPFTDIELWKGLLDEQILRASKSSQEPQQSFALIGPEGGVPGLTISASWEDEPSANQSPNGLQSLSIQSCGEIHLPYEGACSADLFIVPAWHRFFAEKLNQPNAKLRWAVGKDCNYVLVNCDYGEFACATRTPIVDNWVLYKSNDRYINCNPCKE